MVVILTNSLGSLTPCPLYDHLLAAKIEPPPPKNSLAIPQRIKRLFAII